MVYKCFLRSWGFGLVRKPKSLYFVALIFCAYQIKEYSSSVKKPETTNPHHQNFGKNSVSTKKDLENCLLTKKDIESIIEFSKKRESLNKYMPCSKFNITYGPTPWICLTKTMQKEFRKRAELMSVSFIDSSNNPDCPESKCVNNGFSTKYVLMKNNVLPVWQTSQIQDLVELASIDTDISPNSYPGAAIDLYEIFTKYSIFSKRVLVVGSVTPWIESILLSRGARHVFTVDYNVPICNHPHISVLRFDQIGSRLFDIIITFSSLEHSGLGRYGDLLDPRGDIAFVERISQHASTGALFFIAVPSSTRSQLHWNSNRIYNRMDLVKLGGDNFELIDTLGSYRDFDVRDPKLPKFCEGISKAKSYHTISYRYRNYSYGTKARACEGPALLNNWRWQPIHVYRKHV